LLMRVTAAQPYVEQNFLLKLH